jgi:MauM/NapG family ferredoxin protein
LSEDSTPPHDVPGPQDRFHRRGFFTEGFRNLLRPLANLVEKRMQHIDEAFDDGTRSSAGAGGSGPSPGSGIEGYGSPGSYNAGYYPYGSGQPDGSSAASSATPPIPGVETNPTPGEGPRDPESKSELAEASADTPIVPEESAGPLLFLLRPPGALPEGEFLARCTSSGNCVRACPVSAIKLAPPPGGRGRLHPVIEPRSQACVLCAGLNCMSACPSGALQRVPREAVRIGLAVVDVTLCLRSKGEDCRICIEKCPVGRSALDLEPETGRVLVKEAACTGCGLCEMACPTDPAAVVVRRL